jgi:uncharacterized protein YbbC (DUF1343 family)
MRMNTLNIYFLIILFLIPACGDSIVSQDPTGNNGINSFSIITGSEQMELYLSDLLGKKVALVVNHTSKVGGNHLVDTLLNRDIDIVRIFAPEHGFRGEADAGATVKDDFDEKSGLQVVSLYGSKKKPSVSDLSGIDVLVYDIQDVGVRFYTFISTMHYVMEACAEQGITFILLDRPNPNAHYVDGPVLDLAFQSFVGMHPVPVVYGMTVGEYARMIDGEKWLNTTENINIKIIPCLNFKRQNLFELPVKPSPNLPNLRAILLYPSLCFFEGTTVSVGRGTYTQFQVIGHPDLKNMVAYTFTPRSLPGAMDPPHKGKLCYGISFLEDQPGSLHQEGRLRLEPLLTMYHLLKDKDGFFLKNNFFDKLAGTDKLRMQIENNWTEEQIRASWTNDLNEFKLIRQKYLLYE